MAKEDGGKFSRSAQDAIRRKAVKVVVEEGMTRCMCRGPPEFGMSLGRDLSRGRLTALEVAKRPS